MYVLRKNNYIMHRSAKAQLKTLSFVHVLSIENGQFVLIAL